ncbi:Oxidoreductase, short-chain dehydrogenase/reductase family [Olavius algarvensis associated proteobacterium Delta 3]|nr:Oxidoreductase, short-chain dehydrogenase/reductase family [Olavius algarvensis associated proteobacterium Delta 3]CAB5152144.1 Oxidoreductase, short-chain dehydrogenase/reductase family [Olavius algarvensis associated proteobacterium Delta 3]
MKLDGKVAVVTGGARGNGLAAAKLMAAEGADIVIADICENMKTIPYDLSTADTMEKAVAEIEAMDRRALGIKCDVRKAADVEAMVNKVIETFGKIDILVNNAGNSSMVAIAEMEEEVWDEVLDTHLKGTYLCCHFVLPHMIEQHSGNVISISSVGGQRGFGMGGHYCAAKHGIIGLNKSIAMEVADHNIRANVVCPGTVWTDMMQGIAGFFGMEDEEAKETFFAGHLKKEPEVTPEDIGQAVLWLASDDSRCITGNMITVDAGWTAQAP